MKNEVSQKYDLFRNDRYRASVGFHVGSEKGEKRAPRGGKFKFRGLGGRDNGFSRLWETPRNQQFIFSRTVDLAI